MRQILIGLVLALFLAGCGDRIQTSFSPVMTIGAILLTAAAMLAIWRYSAYRRRETRREDRRGAKD